MAKKRRDEPSSSSYSDDDTSFVDSECTPSSDATDTIRGVLPMKRVPLNKFLGDPSASPSLSCCSDSSDSLIAFFRSNAPPPMPRPVSLAPVAKVQKMASAEEEEELEEEEEEDPELEGIPLAVRKIFREAQKQVEHAQINVPKPTDKITTNAGLPQERAKAFFPHQLIAIEWLRKAAGEGRNCILGDEMGLGKTATIVGLLLSLHLRRTTEHTDITARFLPSLVICPSSTVDQWLIEFSRFAPELRVVRYCGSLEERKVLRRTMRKRCGIKLNTHNTDSHVFAFEKGKNTNYCNFDWAVPDAYKDITEKILARPTEHYKELIRSLPEDFDGDVDSYDKLDEATKKELKTLMGDMDLIERYEKWCRKQPIHCIIASHSLLSSRADRSFFLKSYEQDQARFEYLIIDEGHIVKNSVGMRHKTVGKVRAEHKILVTGTPLQNNVDELLALFEILLDSSGDTGHTAQATPVFTLHQFIQDRVKGSSSLHNEQDDTKLIDFLRRMLEPFFLRRLKADVFSNLPKKIVHVEYVPMTREQQTLYDLVLKLGDALIHDRDYRKYITENPKYKGFINRTIASFSKSQGLGLSLLTMLRKLAISATLLPVHTENNSDVQCVLDDAEPPTDVRDMVEAELLSSPKLCKLMEIVRSAVQQKRKILVFSQFLHALDLATFVLQKAGIAVFRLDGSVPTGKRQELIESFNTASTCAMVISTGAGGTGLNLAAASVAVFLDISFNPAVDRQAEDRCHRIGQVRDVDIYKLITKESLEERMLALQSMKSERVDKLIENAQAELAQEIFSGK